MPFLRWGEPHLGLVVLPPRACSAGNPVSPYRPADLHLDAPPPQVCLRYDQSRRFRGHRGFCVITELNRGAASVADHACSACPMPAMVILLDHRNDLRPTVELPASTADISTPSTAIDDLHVAFDTDLREKGFTVSYHFDGRTLAAHHASVCWAARYFFLRACLDTGLCAPREFGGPE